MDTTGQYLNDIGAHPLLTADEERELAQLIERGAAARAELSAGKKLTPARKRQLRRDDRAGAVAKERFINANLRLVVSVAKKYPTVNGIELLDLIQEGNLGLEHAVDKFDWRKGFKFSTYATFWIRQAIGRSLDRHTSVVTIAGGQVSQLRADLRSTGGDPDQLSPDMQRVWRATTTVSLDGGVGDDDGSSTLIDMLADHRFDPEHDALASVAAIEVERLISRLSTHRRREALVLRFGLNGRAPMSYAAIADVQGITGEASRRLVKNALAELRGILESSTPEFAVGPDAQSELVPA